jgi:hypothetical protein
MMDQYLRMPRVNDGTRQYIDILYYIRNSSFLSLRELVPTTGKVYLIIKPGYFGEIEKQEMYIGELLVDPEEGSSENDLRFKQLCKLGNLPENGKLPIIECHEGVTMSREGLGFIFISDAVNFNRDLKHYFPKYNPILTEEQRIAVSDVTKSFPPDIQKYIRDFLEKKDTKRQITEYPSSVGETQVDPLAEPYNPDEDEEDHRDKRIRHDTKGGRKSRRRKNKISRKSRKNKSRRTRRRYRK